MRLTSVCKTNTNISVTIIKVVSKEPGITAANNFNKCLATWLIVLYTEDD